ncbi:MAG TPA: SDR family NAD(P)-dependent oxidoreductase, partial [Polyangiaceae bacterium]
MLEVRALDRKEPAVRRGKLSGKVAVVTGASSGVGRAIARAYAAEGAHVGLIARNSEALEKAAHEARELGGSALVLALDVSDAAAVDSAAQRVVDEWGKIDIWINDAMVSVFAKASEITSDEYERVMAVNYLGYVHGT